MKIHCSISILALMLLCERAYSGPHKRTHDKKNWTTYWNNAKLKPNDPLNLIPGSQVPLQPEKYRWVIIPSISSANVGTVEVAPIKTFTFDPSTATLTTKGTIPIGTEITLDKVTSFSRVIYYGFLEQKAAALPQPSWIDYTWVSGLNIKIDGRQPPK